MASALIDRLTESQSHKKSRRKIKDIHNEPPIQTVVYVPYRSSVQGRFPSVSVHRRPNGKFVVIEQKQMHTQFSDRKTLIDSPLSEPAYQSHVKFRSAKPLWKWSPKGKNIERSHDRSYQEPYLPPIKNRWQVDSKVGSLRNLHYKAEPSYRQVPSFPVKWTVQSKIGSLENLDYKSTGRSSPNGTLTDRSSVKLPQITPRFGAQANSGAWTNIHYTPGSNSVTPRKKNDAFSSIGSFENISYQSGGGNIVISDHRLKWTSESRIGSLENLDYTPRSGNVQVHTERLRWNAKAKVRSLENVKHKPFKRKLKASHFEKDWKDSAASKIGSLSNRHYKPRKGNVQILQETLNWDKRSKISQLWKKKPAYLDNYDSDTDYEDDFEDSGSDIFNFSSPNTTKF